MPNNEATFPCESPRRTPNNHNGDSLISLIGASIQSSARLHRTDLPSSCSFPTSVSAPAGSSSRSPSGQGLSEILSIATDLTREHSHEIDDLFQLADEALPWHEEPKQ
ncbi:unnamed protein product [Cylindrotheca closterium]|uniref:Uncharacterized protein n=1 Tax=Cylindrotheca closterium TaxID=2856 RepID=A0AAD2JJS5_9STRA|nr:unnamed protein product [Cylindrotheca closterium]